MRCMQLGLWEEALQDLALAQRLAQACATTTKHTFNEYVKTFERKGAALSGEHPAALCLGARWRLTWRQA